MILSNEASGLHSFLEASPRPPCQGGSPLVAVLCTLWVDSQLQGLLQILGFGWQRGGRGERGKAIL